VGDGFVAHGVPDVQNRRVQPGEFQWCKVLVVLAVRRRASREVFVLLCGLAMSVATMTGCDGCETPSSQVDGTDLLGVFERDASVDGGIIAVSPSAAASASARASAGPRAPIMRRPLPGACVAEQGAPDNELRRTARRPACRAAKIMEWRDAEGSPRYGCVYQATPKEGVKRPLVIFFHEGRFGPAMVRKHSRLSRLARKFDMTGEPGRAGFVLLAPQGRYIRGAREGIVFDASYSGPDNVDVLTVDHFVEQLIASKTVDPQRIYTIGAGSGGHMAAMYAMMRPGRVAAFATFASDAPAIPWACPTPPPPAAVLYRACDAVTPCQSVEEWISARADKRAETHPIRLGAANTLEPLCAVGTRCGDKTGTANHLRWPKGREKEVLGFLAGFRLGR